MWITLRILLSFFFRWVHFYLRQTYWNLWTCYWVMIELLCWTLWSIPILITIYGVHCTHAMNRKLSLKRRQLFVWKNWVWIKFSGLMSNCLFCNLISGVSPNHRRQFRFWWNVSHLTQMCVRRIWQGHTRQCHFRRRRRFAG